MSPYPFASFQDEPSLREALAQMFQKIFRDPGCIGEFFTDDYRQITDGKLSDRGTFEAHIRHVAASVSSIRFTVLDAVLREDVLADRHLVEVTHVDGRESRLEVYLFGRLLNDRLALVHEVTRVIDGDEKLRALATAIS
ncbi:nuclear transport factor 2 family protein [Telmatospirillum sp. J64-1]|uniref:nuclear transport factor 2 family protein n=1 Tax=Telmatospirillum sp. J64-1 TaxID=2502183 RepID=UPI00115D722A|nr:nuclear transport factor 2 family protein [Telmatospirillum sp. J64-1]